MTDSTPSLPRGGGAIKGLGEQFKTNPFTGTATFNIPVPTPSARGLEPSLAVSYGSASGAGVFGMGFALNVPWIGLRTDRVRPHYDHRDDYFMSNKDVLVPRHVSDESRSDDRRYDEFETREDEKTYQVRRYIPRAESDFARIERYQSGLDVHWRVTDGNNQIHFYGRTNEARVHHPRHPERVFRWQLEETRDPLGNRIVYEYKKENSEGLSNDDPRRASGSLYLKRIKYGNYGHGRWAFEIVLDYGEHIVPGSMEAPSITEQRPWTKRRDSWSDFTAGFETRVHRLCRNILNFHHLPDASGDMVSRLVNRLAFEYDESPTRALLKQARRHGYRLENGEYKTASLPPLDLDYTPFEPHEGTYKELKTAGERFVPGVPDGESFRFLDLDGEGLPGMLHTRDGSVLYWAPRGGGRLNKSRSQFEFPVERNNEDARYSLQDLENSGRMNLVVSGPEQNGFYEIEPTGGWKIYRAFRAATIPEANLTSDQVDLTGDGFPDLLTYRENDLLINRSRGKLGFAPASTMRRNRDFPAGNFAWARELVTFADLFGDGLSHRVRIRSGTVEVWPNLGYGAFGDVIRMSNAPRFEGDFNASRLRLADVDGSGTADLIYMHAGHFTVYFNEAGGGFSAGERFPLPEGFDDFDQVNVADIEGTGTASLVLSKNKPEVRHVYFDFARGRKPYMLNRMNNNLGGLTRLEYKPSTYFYLKDRENDRPWITRLPFPVQLVERSEIRDDISGTKLVSRFAYHHGYYDPFYREFRGFGMVEKWDAETLEEKVSARNEPDKEDEIVFDSAPDELHAMPVLTRTWNHTGVFLERGPVSRHLAEEYYQGDVQSPSLPDSRLEDGADKVRSENLFWAYRALGGRMLREEVYGLDGESEHPYSVTESNYSIRLIQRDQDDEPPVFSVLPRESLSIHYERDPHDPRVEHEVLLEADQFDLPLQQLNIYYPRRPGPDRLPEQENTRAILTATTYAHETRDFYRLGMPVEAKAMEIIALPPTGNNQSATLNFAVIRERIAQALDDVRPYEEYPLPGETKPRARLLEHSRIYYRGDHDEEAAPFGRATALGLIHHTETAVMSPGLVKLAFGARVTDEMLREEGGYVLKDGLWWRPGEVTHHDPEQYYLPVRVTDPFGVEGLMEYDEFALRSISTTDAVGLVTNTSLDYDAMAPREITDPNGIASAVMYDPLGRVSMTAVAKKGADGRITRGDELPKTFPADGATLDDVIEQPGDFLRGAGELFIYDDEAYIRDKLPARALQVQRRQFITNGEGSASDGELLLRIVHSDGMSRPLQTKLRIQSDRWQVSGRVVFDNKGRSIKKYEPLFSAAPNYETEIEVREHGITPVMHYDPLGRVFRVDTPKGFLARVNFSPWSRESYDENDTVLEAPYYLEHENNQAPGFADERDALLKALRHAGTPNRVELDNIGNEISQTALLEDATRLVTKRRPDIQDNELELTDPRLSKSGHGVNFQRVFNMAGETLSVRSADNGLRHELKNVLGNTIHTWNQAGYQVTAKYDSLQRPVSRFVSHAERGLNQIVERMTYGDELEDRENAEEANLLGRPAVHRHQAGIDYMDAYSIGGNPERTRRRLRREYKVEANWNDPDGEELESETWFSSTHYNAMEWAVLGHFPDGSTTRPRYDAAGKLTSLLTAHAGEDEIAVIRNIEYNAKNQRLAVTYGNETRTNYEYETATFRLMRLETARLKADGSPGRILRDIRYAYDPAGNTTRIRDESHKNVFNANTIVEPLCDYTYDSLYRLTRASGREHPGLAGTERKDYRARARDPKDGMNIPGLNDDGRLAPYIREYQYDDAGNLLETRHRAADTSASWTRAFTVSPESNRAFTADSLGGRTADELYDSNGNRRELDHLRALRWDYRDNIQSAEIISRDDATPDAEYYTYDAGGMRVRRVRERLIKRGETNIEFEYDAEGNRTERTIANRGPDVVEVEEKIHLGGIEIKRVRRESKITLERRTLHVMDGEHRLALLHHWTVNETKRERPSGEKQSRYQLSNHIGSSSLELDAKGLVISYEEYFPYGGTALLAGRNRREVDLKEYRYSGKERDDSTGLYYYGARYYAPWTFRWLSADPAGTVDGPNLYAFVGGNPVTYEDSGGTMKRRGRGGGGPVRKSLRLMGLPPVAPPVVAPPVVAPPVAAPPVVAAPIVAPPLVVAPPPPPPPVMSAVIPELTDALVTAADAELTADHRQNTLDELMHGIFGLGVLAANQLENRDTDATGAAHFQGANGAYVDAHGRQRGVAYRPGALNQLLIGAATHAVTHPSGVHLGVVRPVEIEFTDYAFTHHGANIAILYSILRHELVHFEQFQQNPSRAVLMAGAAGGRVYGRSYGGNTSMGNLQEVDAYLFELENMNNFGTAAHPAYIRSIEGRLDHYWGHVAGGDKPFLQARYDAVKLTLNAPLVGYHALNP